MNQLMSTSSTANIPVEIANPKTDRPFNVKKI